MALPEFDLIERYFSDIIATDNTIVCGIGDDAAILQADADEELLVAVDSLVSGTHFSASASASDIAYKALAVNLSDIAAMGGKPRWATLALTLPAIDEDWLAEFARGFRTLAAEHGVSLVGGDTTRGPLSITVQLMGSVRRGQGLRRSGAKVGDLVYVSGDLGAAGLAYTALQRRQSVPAACLARLHRPTARVALGRQLCGLASACIDISDGLHADLGHLLRASGVAAALQLEALPLHAELQHLQPVTRRWQLALAAGDDYELCFTLPAAQQARLMQVAAELSCPLSCIGKVEAGSGVHWSGADAEALDLAGYRHF